MTVRVLNEVYFLLLRGAPVTSENCMRVVSFVRCSSDAEIWVSRREHRNRGFRRFNEPGPQAPVGPKWG